MTISIVEIESDAAHLSKQKIHEVIKEQEDKILYVAYILHDKDKYTADDEQQEAEKAAAANRAVDPSIKAGGLKKPHYHTEKNYTNYISGELYAQHRGKIESAFAFCRDKNKTLNRKMDVIMIYGPGGIGKTAYAKMLAETKGFDSADIFVSSSGEDILCGYKGEGCIIVDDFRKEQMSFVEFLKMTDNNTNSSVRSRYTNKDISNCKLMIVTSIYSLETLFVGNSGEDMVQLYRRFKLQLKIEADTITPYAYVRSIKTFLPTTPYQNPVRQLEKAAETEELKNEQDVYNFLGIPSSTVVNGKSFKELGEEQKNNNKNDKK